MIHKTVWVSMGTFTQLSCAVEGCSAHEQSNAKTERVEERVCVAGGGCACAWVCVCQWMYELNLRVQVRAEALRGDTAVTNCTCRP